MNTFIKIAWRNIIRNRNRSLLTILMISSALAGVIFIKAFISGADYQMIDNYTSLNSGHIQIHKQGFKKKMGLDLSIENPRMIKDKVSSIAGITAYAPRVKEYSLVNSAEHSSGALIIGINPEKETKVTEIDNYVYKGEFLTPEPDNQILVGEDLFESLKVRVGDKIVITGQDLAGQLIGGAFRIKGVLKTGAEEIDKGYAFIHIQDAQSLYGLTNRISEFSLKTADVYNADKYVEELEKIINTDEYEILHWRDIEPVLFQWLVFDRYFLMIIMVILILVAAAGILNTVLMGVLERIREFGIMLSVGTKRKQIVLTVTLESLFLGIIGIFAGLTAGLSISLISAKLGIDLAVIGSAGAFESYYMGTVIYPRITLFSLVSASSLVLITSILASIMPAFKASTLKPVEALRYF